MSIDYCTDAVGKFELVTFIWERERKKRTSSFVKEECKKDTPTHCTV